MFHHFLPSYYSTPLLTLYHLFFILHSIVSFVMLHFLSSLHFIPFYIFFFLIFCPLFLSFYAGSTGLGERSPAWARDHDSVAKVRTYVRTHDKGCDKKDSSVVI